MTFFNINNPFVQASSLTYMLLYFIKASIFYPIFFWGCYRHVTRRSLPLSFYLVLGAVLFFGLVNLFGNDLVTITLAILAVYYLANPTGDRLSTIVSYFGYSMLVYYFSSTIGVILSRIVLLKWPQFGSLLYFFLIPLIYAFALVVIKLTRPLSDRYFRWVNNRHPVAEWALGGLFIPLSLFFYYVQYEQPVLNRGSLAPAIGTGMRWP